MHVHRSVHVCIYIYSIYIQVHVFKQVLVKVYMYIIHYSIHTNMIHNAHLSNSQTPQPTSKGETICSRSVQSAYAGCRPFGSAHVLLPIHSVRWWRKVFLWVVEVVVVNSYILYAAHTDAHRKHTHKEFRRNIVLSLCQPLRDMTTHHQPALRDHTMERLRGRHFTDTSSTRRDCRVCSSRQPGQQRHLTTIICATCSDHPHLCAWECFRIYHTRVNI